MAVPTQFACKSDGQEMSCLPRITRKNLFLKHDAHHSLDRTLKGIGVVQAAPVYDSLPGFERFVLGQKLLLHPVILTDPPVTRPEGNLRCCVYSPCGRYFAWASPER